MPPITLTPEQFQRIAKAIADPTRYEMMRRIFSKTGEMTCSGALCGLPISAATGSHHLRELELADLVGVTKDGRFRILTPRRDIWRAYLAQLRKI